MSRSFIDSDAKPVAVRLAKSPFDQIVLVCGKCARKLPGRGAKDVRSQLKAALKGRRWGKVRVVESRCLDLCPKRRQVLASARTLADRRLLVVDPQFDANLVLAQLLGPPLDLAAPPAAAATDLINGYEGGPEKSAPSRPA